MYRRVHEFVKYLLEDEELLDLSVSNLEIFLPVTNTGYYIYNREQADSFIRGLRDWIQNIRRHQSQMGTDERQELDDYLRNRDYINDSTLFKALIKKTASDYTPDLKSTKLWNAKALLASAGAFMLFGGVLLYLSLTLVTRDQWLLYLLTSACFAALVTCTAFSVQLYKKYYEEQNMNMRQYKNNLEAIKDFVEQLESDLSPRRNLLAGPVAIPVSREDEGLNPPRTTTTPPFFSMFSIHLQGEEEDTRVARTRAPVVEVGDDDDDLLSDDNSLRDSVYGTPEPEPHPPTVIDELDENIQLPTQSL